MLTVEIQFTNLALGHEIHHSSALLFFGINLNSAFDVQRRVAVLYENSDIDDSSDCVLFDPEIAYYLADFSGSPSKQKIAPKMIEDEVKRRIVHVQCAKRCCD